MEPVAYGLLGLTPGAFGALTAREFAAMAEAAGDRLNEDREFAASLVLPLIQILTRKPKTLDALLGPVYTAWKLRRAYRHHEQQMKNGG